MKEHPLVFTSIEQSEKLVELGLNQETADMSYYDGIPQLTTYSWNKRHIEFLNEDCINVLPCWSLGQLIESLPRFIKFKKGQDIVECRLQIYPDVIGNWNVDYSAFEVDFVPIDFQDKNLLDAVFYMVCYLLETSTKNRTSIMLA